MGDKRTDKKRFFKNTSGNIAVTTALLGIPLMLSAGAAVDYSQYARKQSSLQNVTDAATLAVATRLQTQTRAELEASVDDFLKANLSALQYSEIQNVTVNIPLNKTSVQVLVTGKHPTSLMRLAGIETLTYTPQSRVSAPVGNAEIILVLDSTGSMSQDNKLNELKASAKMFTTNLLASNQLDERVKIGIVPFSNYVNVGLDNREANWLSVPDDYMETVMVKKRDVLSTSNCREDTYVDTEGVTQTYEKCDREYGPEYEVEQVNEYTWRGCVGSRKYPRNLIDDKYNHKVPGLMNTWCPKRVTQLTADEDTLEDAIDALSASGTTYIPTGLTWGLRAISAGDPFDDGISYQEAEDKEVSKVIVLMTDGENSVSVDPDNTQKHTGSNTSQSEDYTQEICNNIKDKNIRLFTISFGNDISLDTMSMLQQCSSDGVDYYDAKDGAALTEAFGAITSKITQLYLNK